MLLVSNCALTYKNSTDTAHSYVTCTTTQQLGLSNRQRILNCEGVLDEHGGLMNAAIVSK